MDEEFDFSDMETGNQLVVIVYDPDDESVRVENPHHLPFPMVLGLLHTALDEVDAYDWQEIPDE